MLKGVFITGTDTGVGKTEISTSLVAALSARGLRVGVSKPAETGCEWNGERLVGDDAERLALAAGLPDGRDVAARLFREPAAPLAAAEAEAATLDPEELLRHAVSRAADKDLLVVEGAGGLEVPITDGFTYRDFAVRLGFPVVLVVGSKLGCINHALLSLRSLDDAGLQVLGYIVNELSSDSDVALRSNRNLIARFTEHRDLGRMPFQLESAGAGEDRTGQNRTDASETDTARRAAAAEEHLTALLDSVQSLTD